MKTGYNRIVHQLFRDFEKAHDSVRREVLYNILNEFGLPMKLVRLIKMCLNETYSKVRISKKSVLFLIQNVLKQRDPLSLLRFSVALEYAIRRVQGNQGGMESDRTHQLAVYTDDVNILGEITNTINEIKEIIL
jgi:hypothetical protein